MTTLLSRFRGRPSAQPEEALHPSITWFLLLGPEALSAPISREIASEVSRLWRSRAARAAMWRAHEVQLLAFARTHKIGPLRNNTYFGQAAACEEAR